MKNFSKKNYSNKNSNKYNKRSDSKNYFESNDFHYEKNSSKKNNNSIRKSPHNQNLIKHSDQPIQFGKDAGSRPSIRRANTFTKNDSFSTKNNYQQYINKKNFEDWIWGKHSVYSALTNNRPINRIWCTSDVFSSEKFYTLLKEFKSKGVLVEEVTWNRLSQLTSGATHQGVVLQLASSECISLNELINISLKKSKNPLIIALDGITDPHNIGAIIRSAEAFDCKGIIIPQRRSAGLTGTVAKVAAGALNHIPVSRVVNLNKALDEIKKKGFLVIGLSSNCKTPISNYDEKSPLVLVVGAEDKGISLLTQRKCDYLLTIPLKGKTSSLNASVATAITLYHLTNK